MSEMVDEDLLGDDLDDGIYDITNEREEALLQDDDEYSKGSDYKGRKHHSDSEAEDVLDLDVEEDDDKLLYEEDDEDQPQVRNSKFTSEAPKRMPERINKAQNVLKPPVKPAVVHRRVPVMNKKPQGKNMNLRKPVRKNENWNRGNPRPNTVGGKANYPPQRRNGTVLINPRYEGTVQVDDNNARLAWDSQYNSQNNVNPSSSWGNQNCNVITNCEPHFAMNNSLQTGHINFPPPPKMLLQPQNRNFYEPPPSYERPISFEPPPQILENMRVPQVPYNTMDVSPHYRREKEQFFQREIQNTEQRDNSSNAYSNNYNQYSNPPPNFSVNYNNMSQNNAYDYNRSNDGYRNTMTNQFNNYPCETRGSTNEYTQNTAFGYNNRPIIPTSSSDAGYPNFKMNQNWNKTQHRHGSNDQYKNNFNQRTNFGNRGPDNGSYDYSYENNYLSNTFPKKKVKNDYYKVLGVRPPVKESTVSKNVPEKKPKLNESPDMVSITTSEKTENVEVPVQIEQTPVITEPEEDEETKQYRLKIEEQKREREKILKMKEERRKQMALERQMREQQCLPPLPKPNEVKTPVVQQQKQQNVSDTIGVQIKHCEPAGHVQQTKTFSVTQKPNTSSAIRQNLKELTVSNRLPQSSVDVEPNPDNISLTFNVSNNFVGTNDPPKNEPSSSNFMSNRVVLVKSKTNQQSAPPANVSNETNNQSSDVGQGLSSFFNGRTVLKKDKNLIDTRLVVVSNLSATINQNKLMTLTRGLGEIQDLRMDTKERQATILFKSVASAHAFYKKNQRRILDDLSVIEVKLEPML